MSWPRPSLVELLRRTAEDFKSRLEGDPFLKVSFEAALSKVLAGLAHGLYGHQEWIARQAVPGPDADDETNLAWAAMLLDPPRVLATRASGPATFTGTDTTPLPAGTELSIGDVLYTVDADGVVAGGTVTVNVTAVRAGASGNAEYGARIRLTTPIAGLDSEGVVGVGDIEGGTDDETIASVLERLIARLSQPPRGGGPTDFEKWALETPGVSVRRAWEFAKRGGAGTVALAFVVDDETEPVKLPSAGEMTTVENYINSKRPTFMREFSIITLTPVDFTIHAKITPFSTAIEDALRLEFADLLERLSEPEETLFYSRIVEVLTNAEDLDNFELVTPLSSVTPGTGAIFVYNPATITFEELV